MEGVTMKKRNESSVTEFVLVGLSDNPQVQVALFVLFFGIYFLTLLGNMTLVTVCIREPRLHTPMYFFLAHLLLLDCCFSSAVVPNMLYQFLGSRKMSFSRCAAQMYIFLLFGATECVFLAVMAYDRYVAILFPLRYTVIMSKTMCITLVASSWLSGNLTALLDTVLTMRLSFCDHNVINHFFCEASALLRLACEDTFIAQLVIIIKAIFDLIIPSIFTLFSYICIIATIIRIRSSQARYKAFSTCGSHLIVVTIFYSTAIFMYLKPVSKDTANRDKLISVFYTVTPPMLNPLIYSLRNKDVKLALWKTLQIHKLLKHFVLNAFC